MEETLYDGQGRPIAYISDAMRCLFIFGRAMPWHTLLKKIFTAGTASTSDGLLMGYFTTDGDSAWDQSAANALTRCMLLLQSMPSTQNMPNTLAILLTLGQASAAAIARNPWRAS